jgi:hypothetical protein
MAADMHADTAELPTVDRWTLTDDTRPPGAMTHAMRTVPERPGLPRSACS